MCGIVGYIGSKSCLPILIGGLKRLEYRGYDSAGIGFIRENKLQIAKAVGKVSVLEKKIETEKNSTTIGIGHTRWATHGIPNEINAHPHSNTKEDLIVIHNGII